MSAITQNHVAKTRELNGDGDLPEGWASVLLPEICDINPPKPRADALPSGELVTFVPMPAVEAEAGAITGSETRPFSKVRKGFTAFQDGDVIFAKITPCMENGKAAVARNLLNGFGFGSTEFHVIRSNGAVLPEYVYHFVRQESFRKLAEAEMTGSVGQKRVPSAFVKQTELTLAPLAEQKRIVAKIEELFTENNAARARLAKVAHILKRFRQAVLAAACSGQLTEEWRAAHPKLEPARELLKKIERERNKHQGRTHKTRQPVLTTETNSDLSDLPDRWCWTTINQVADVRGGIQKQPKRAPKLNAYPYLRVANVLRGKLDLAEMHKMELFEGELETYRLQPDDLLIVEGNGSLSEIGRSALWNGEIENCVHQNHIIRVRAQICSTAYLNAYWNSPLGTARIAELAVTTAGLYNLSTQKVSRMPIPLPPLDEQHEIVRRVEAFFKLADSIEKSMEKASKHANRLTQAILAKAFRGELVPTEAELARREGRDYEPASALLARIKTKPKSAEDKKR